MQRTRVSFRCAIGSGAQIIPFLEKQFGRPIRKSIWRAAALAAEEDGFFDELIPRGLTRSTQLAVEPLRAMPLAVQRRMVHGWLQSGDVSNVSFDLVERVRALLDLSNRVAKTNLPGRLHVRRRGGDAVHGVTQQWSNGVME